MADEAAADDLEALIQQARDAWQALYRAKPSQELAQSLVLLEQGILAKPQDPDAAVAHAMAFIKEYSARFTQ